MGLLGSNKADNSTNANDHSLTQAQDSIGTTVKGGQGATGQDQAVTLAGGSRNTVDQSLHLADNTGSTSLAGNKIGNNSTVSIQTTTTTTDHGAIESAYKFGSAALDTLNDLAKEGASVVRDAVSDSMSFAGKALAGNSEVVTAAMLYGRDVANDAFSYSDAVNARTLGLVSDVGLEAIDAVKSASSKAQDTALSATKEALSYADANNARNLGAITDIAGNAFSLVDATNARNLGAITDTTNQAFSFADSTNSRALQVVSDTNSQAYDVLWDAMNNMQRTTLETINASRDNSSQTNLMAENLIGQMSEKFSENKSASLTENKTLIWGAVALAAILAFGGKKGKN